MVASVRMGTFQVSLEISESAAAAMPTRGIVTSKGHQTYIQSKYHYLCNQTIHTRALVAKLFRCSPTIREARVQFPAPPASI